MAESPEAAPRKGRKDRRKRKDRTSTAAEAVPTAVGELPPGIEADPNEPRYCYCNQVSYGEMVGCDVSFPVRIRMPADSRTTTVPWNGSTCRV